ncbi:MAG: ABC transporter substrate-binding protein [Eubacteriales bacterium]|nr:ABC transporter substrate-binding protein [Eubacteriales bacterium]
MKQRKVVMMMAVAMVMTAVTACAGGTKKVTGSKGDQYAVTSDTKKVKLDTEKKDYEPYTITLNLERSGIGQNMEETFTAAPTKAVVDGDQMVDFFLDLGLEDHVAGYTRGACLSTVSEFPNREKLNKFLDDGVNLEKASKEQVLQLDPDFMIGWDSLFSEDHFSVAWCLEHKVIPYFPYCCSDSATMEDVYKDYEVLGNIFGVQERAAERVQAMKDTIAKVEETLGAEVYQKPISVFVYDSGEDAPFTACQGVPGDMIKKAGGISIFDDIKKGWATPSWEEVVARDPDVILVLDYNYDTEAKINFLKTSNFTKNLRAVKEGRIYSACCSDMQGSAGSANEIRRMAEQFYAEKFK